MSSFGGVEQNVGHLEPWQNVVETGHVPEKDSLAGKACCSMVHTDLVELPLFCPICQPVVLRVFSRPLNLAYPRSGKAYVDSEHDHVVEADMLRFWTKVNLELWHYKIKPQWSKPD